jgi:hypothetical protein
LALSELQVEQSHGKLKNMYILMISADAWGRSEEVLTVLPCVA